MTATPLPPAIKFVLATILINAAGFGIIMPVTPRLVMELGHATLSEATAIGGTLALLYAGTQFVFGPLLGNLSDRFGRRPILLGSLLGFALDFLMLAFAPTLAWLYLGRFLSGIFGATNGPAQSAIADLTPPEDRARVFGLISAAFGVGFVFGPVIGGLLGEFGHRVPFFAAAALAALNLVYGLFAFPETLKPQNRRTFDWRRANPVGSLMHVRRLPGILPIAAVYLLWQVASLIYPMTWSYFAYGRYGWSAGMVGVSLSVVGIVMALVQTFLTGRVVTRFGERRAAMIGLLGGATAMAAYAIIPNGYVAFLAMIPLGLQSFTHPALTAMMSRRASADTQGEIQGFASSIMALGAVIAPLTYNPLLAWATGPEAPFVFWGAAFVVAAVLALIALLILWRTAPAHVPDPALRSHN
jgi:DHA1 family tetracycline resistance protein-like MFS transporter